MSNILFFPQVSKKSKGMKQCTVTHFLLLFFFFVTIIRTAAGASMCGRGGCPEVPNHDRIPTGPQPARQESESEEILGFIVGNQDFYARDLEDENPLDEWLDHKGGSDWGRMIMFQRRYVISPWPDALIPYVVWGDKRTKRIVNSTISALQRSTCLAFKTRTDEERYVVIKEGRGGCWTSSLGYPPRDKKVIINLGVGCRFPGKIMHEILHAAGFLHEHTRPDRGSYLEVKWQNIRDDARKNYGIDMRYSTLDIPYDYKSIMHYGRHTFAKTPRHPTLVPKLPVAGDLGGSKLSHLDIRRINTFYECA
ncbi:astacin-like metalloprotease toxin 2 [Penaeus japonicus]|uniref:astacin-like metalloprotease toxin 2 n=1 Tax=Penaeus japonicus TaxID=27405 RepID=UPI001C715752|nr:astacin-like metalloprotease toxin 2 [Penaeus japonicus]